MSEASSGRNQDVPPCLYVVVVRLREGLSSERVEEWHRWYDTVHAPALLAVWGIHSIRRWRRLDRPDEYLALYEVDGPETFEQEDYRQAAGWGPFSADISSWGRRLYRLDDSFPSS
jgi:hypothetical protein